jgi:cobalt-precorrin 5A hydrolase
MIVAGIGFRKHAPLSALAEVLAAVEAQGGTANALASAPEKAAQEPLITLARARALPLIAVQVAGIQTPTQSPQILARFGTGSLAEAAALAGAGPGARLLVGRITSADGMATAALAASIKEHP